MTLRRFIAMAFALCAVLSTKAQLRSVGPLPQDFRLSVDELYEADMQRAKKYAGGRVRNKQQVLEASYGVHELLTGGHIVYGDPISSLLERIADTLLTDYPELRSELRFYTVTSPEVNAFTTGQGMIFVNVGLVAQVENEAQLAFILSHEIIHYYRSHLLEEIVNKNKKRTADVDQAEQNTSDLMRHHRRSREMENEADSLGVTLFYLRSPYDKHVSEGVFDVLQYSELPFDDIPFDTTWFNTPYFTLTGCWLEQTADITSRDNYDDSRSTHPNILSRRHKMATALYGHGQGQQYVISTPDEFAALQLLARKESIRQELIHGEYARALYNIWTQLKSQPDDAELTLWAAQALYGTARFKAHNRGTTVTGDHNKVEGESQQLHYALKKMSSEVVSLVALHKIWEAHRRFPSETAYTQMATDLMEELRTVHKKSIIDFVSEIPKATDTTTAVSTASAASETQQVSKYERIKQKRITQTLTQPTAYALTDLLQTDSQFADLLREHLSGTSKPSKVETPESKSMIVFDPSYSIYDKKQSQLKVKQSSRAEEDLRHRVSATTEHFGMRTVDLSDGAMHEMANSNQYNDFLTMCEWINEFWLTKGDFAFARITQPLMNDLLNRRDASLLNVTAVYNEEGLEADLSPTYLMIIPIAPVVVAGMMTGRENTSLISIVVDAKEGKMLAREAYHYNTDDEAAMIDAMLYDTYASAFKHIGSEPVGFMGKRLAIKGGATLSLSGAQPMKQLHKYVAISPWAELEFAIKRNRTISLWGSYRKAYDVTTTEWYQSYDYQTNNWIYDERYMPNSADIISIGLGTHRYFRSDFAPLGLYFNFGGHLDQLTFTYDGKKHYTGGVHAGLGRNHIFAHLLMLNWEILYSYSYGASKSFSMASEDDLMQPYVDNLVSGLIGFRLGIGLIPF